MILDVIIKDVTFRDVVRKSGPKQGETLRIFEVEDHTGIKWTTSRQDIANDAFRKIGQQVQIQGREEQNGVYQNHYLDMISEPGVLTPAPSDAFPIPGTIQAQISAPGLVSGEHSMRPGLPMPSVGAPTAFATAPAAPSIQPSGPTENDWMIWRQVATKVSAKVSNSAAEFWSNLDDLVRYYAYGTKPTHVPHNGETQQEPQQGRFIPEGTLEPDTSSMDELDSDIPF